MNERPHETDDGIRWAATLPHVREVSLLGTADLGFWKDRLREEDLVPLERDGEAQVMLIAADSKFIGIAFRELGVSVLARPDPPADGTEGAYLLRAWNSFRFFAFCERAFFATPYSHGDVRVRVAAPAAVRLVVEGKPILSAEMGAATGAPARPPAASAGSGWEGPVYLPGRGNDRGRGGKMFFARLRGRTETFPFLPSRDTLTLTPSQEVGAIQPLADSHFAATEWVLRADATHSKSRTYRRTLAGAFPR
jgi:hypothetical protein